MINWKNLEPRRVERAIKLLIRELHPTAQGIDGAGGDDGRDIRWDSQEGLVVFEAKSYSARLSGGQKAKIKNSLKNAAKHKPVRWVLILPLEPSPGEEGWFDSLRTAYPRIELEWRGVDWLDGKFAAHEHLRRYVEGTDYDLLQRAQELRIEEAALANGTQDLAKRLGRLAERAQELSPYWNIGMSSQAGRLAFTYSERFPGAADLDPVMLTPTFSFPIDDPEASEAERRLTHVLDYGGDVTVDGRFVERFDIEASEETRRLFGAESFTETEGIRIVSAKDADGLPIPCTLEVLDSDDRPLASLEVQMTDRTSGLRGVTVSGADISGVLKVTTTVDYPGAESPKGKFDFSLGVLAGRFPYAVRPVANFFLAMEPGRRVAMRLGPSRLGYAILDEAFTDDVHISGRLVVAMDELQRHFGQIFPIPDDLTYVDVRDLEMLREITAGRRTQWRSDAIRANIRHDRLEDFLALATVRDERGAIFVDTDYMSFMYGEHSFKVGPVRLVGSRMELTNYKELEAAVGTGIDPEARWVCTEDEHIYIEQLKMSKGDGVEGNSSNS